MSGSFESLGATKNDANVDAAATSISFGRKVFTLLTGTTVSQLIPIAASPVLTRLFTPDDFGILALFMSISVMAAIPMTLRYHLAILLPHDDESGRRLVVLSLILCILVGLPLMAAGFLLGSTFANAIGQPDFASWVGWCVASGMLTSIYLVGYTWHNRVGQFRQMATSRIAQTGGVAGSQITLGAIGAGATGLILGTLLGQVVGCFTVFRQALNRNRSLLAPVKSTQMKEVGNRYRAFPKYSLPADLINAGANQLPVVLMTSYFTSAVVGLYNLTYRVVAAPLALLAGAVLDVFRQEAAREFAEYGTCRKVYKKTLYTLSILAILPFGLLFAIAPDAFAFVFGAEWRVAGEYARLLTPLFYLRFVASPLAYTIYIAEKQHADLIWQVCLFILVNAAMIIGGIKGDPSLALLLFSASYSGMYLIYLIMSYRFSNGDMIHDQP